MSFAVFVPLLFAAIPQTQAPGAPQVGLAPRWRGTFVERAAEVGLIHELRAGLDRVGSSPFLVDWAQIGVAVGDLDGDDWLDVVAAGGLNPSSVFVNDGAGEFLDVTAQAGVQSPEYERAVTLGDLDRDGDLDLVFGVHEALEGPLPGRNRLLANDGTGSFAEVTELSGARGSGHTLFVHLADFDLDGRLDMYTSEFNATDNPLYRGYDGFGFRDVAFEVGAKSGGSTHVAALVDVDGDSWPEILGGNDFTVTLSSGMENNEHDTHLHGGPGGFADVTSLSGVGFFSTTMGMTFGDVDYDGLLDVYKTEWGSNWLRIYRGWPDGDPWYTGEFEFGVVNELVVDEDAPSGQGPGVGWGCLFMDADLDPWLDLYSVNGHISLDDPRDQPNAMFFGGGPEQSHFLFDVTDEVGLWERVDDRALSAGDIDRDGDLDLIVGPTAGPLRYHENQLSRRGTWLRVVAQAQTSARGGVGARVSWVDDLGLPHVRPIGADAPTASQRPNEVVLGLGFRETVDVEVRFPSGVTLAFDGVPTGGSLTALEPELVRAPERVAPGETFVVEAFAHDAAGERLAAGTSVQIDAIGAIPLGPVVPLGGNAFERSFQAAGDPAGGEHRVTVAFGAFEVLISPRISVVGAASADATRVFFEPECVRAGSSDPVRTIIVPRDAFGALLGAGHTVRALIPSQALELPLADVGDGRYELVGSAPASPGLVTIVAEVDGVALGSGQLEVAGLPTEASSLFYDEVPEPTSSAYLHEYKLEVTPRDAGGRRLGPAALVALVAIPDEGTEPVEVLQLPPQADGDFGFVLVREPSTLLDSARGTFEIRADGALIHQGSYLF